MATLQDTAPAFVDVAHRIVWATVATVDRSNRPRSRILHPIWEWDGHTLSGWVATAPTPVKRAHLDHSPYVSVNYWDPHQDVATAECAASWHLDDATCERVWELFVTGPEPVGYDPSIVPAWTSPRADAFAVLRLEPWRLRVFPAAAGTGAAEVLVWGSGAA
ncbi:MAG TPA: pyridoxamine 5'-phosphate oxidase family protein [Egicoccus sp.]|nr:pyridoxamine 5'-phosphate oxidase family protein [Egicoccus sp.]HSK23569.1 pyridoxamine 5'-phosphate oxidase family protein [Egicoccus sp.]